MTQLSSNVPARAALAISERAYEESVGSAPWLDSVVDSACSLFHRDHLGVLASVFRVDVAEGIRIVDVATRGVDAQQYRRVVAQTEPELLSAIFAPGPIVQVSKRIRRDHPSWQQVEATGVREIVGFVCRDSSAMGCNVAFNVSSPVALSAVEKRRLSRAAVHVATGLRLLLRNGPDEAVLAPDGRVLDARGMARDRSLLEQLRRAAIERDRFKSAGADPDAALEAWRALVAGRWSLVERFDSDGRRFWVARENAPRQVAARALNELERAVVGFLALGHSQKLVAYELGIVESTVSRIATRIRQKLGVRSNGELIDLWAILVDQPVSPGKLELDRSMFRTV